MTHCWHGNLELMESIINRGKVTWNIIHDFRLLYVIANLLLITFLHGLISKCRLFISCMMWDMVLSYTTKLSRINAKKTQSEHDLDISHTYMFFPPTVKTTLKVGIIWIRTHITWDQNDISWRLAAKLH